MTEPRPWTTARRFWVAFGLVSPLFVLTVANAIYRARESGSVPGFRETQILLAGLLLLSSSLAGFFLSAREVYIQSSSKASIRIVTVVGLSLVMVLFNGLAASIFVEGAMREIRIQEAKSHL